MNSYYCVSIPLDIEKWQRDKLNKRLDYLRNIYNIAASYIKKRYLDLAQKKSFKCLDSDAHIVHFLLENTFFDNKNKKNFSLTKFGISHYVMQLVKKDMGNNVSYKQKGVLSHSVEYIANMLYYSVMSSIKNHKMEPSFEKKDYYHFNSFCISKSHDNFDGLKIDFKNRLLIINMNGRQRKQADFLILKMRDPQKCGRFVYDNMPTDKTNIFEIRITRKLIRAEFKYYIIFCLKGIPSYSNLKIGKGRVGIDLGPSTIAFSSEKSVGIRCLNDNYINLDKKAISISKKMNRSRRINNPEMYNENGTYKDGIDKSTWKKSKRYIILQNKHYDIIRKIVTNRKFYQQQIIRELIQTGDTFIVERNEFWKWMKRTSKTIIDKNTGKTRSKKSRLGKSIKNNAPRDFLDRLTTKVNYLGGEVHLVSPKNAATQFDFTCQQFVKRELKEKQITLSNKMCHHRDIMAAFNLQHLNYDSNKLRDYDILNMQTDYKKFYILEKEYFKSSF